MATSSLREQLLARVQAVLAADAAVVAAGVQLVSRSREVSITRAKSPAIVVLPDNGETTRLASAGGQERARVRPGDLRAR
jgi:hypothetical protein